MLSKEVTSTEHQPTGEIHMMVKRILASGPFGILAAGGGVLFAQHELHYLLRPSMVETFAGIAAVGGAVMWAKSKAKRQAQSAQTHDDAPIQATIITTEAQRQTPHALPNAQAQYVQFDTQHQVQAQPVYAHRVN
jgi:type II secretory pathway predicted ATPase ExeA